MSIGSEINDRFPNEIDTVRVDKSYVMHGENAVQVVVNLVNGTSVEGTFTTESKPGFGGVDFMSKKDVVGLMTAKIKSVLEGTAE